MSGYYIGIDVGGTKIAYGLFDPSIALVSRHKSQSNNRWSQQEFVQQVVRDVGEILASNQLREGDVAGIAIGFPSYVDFKKGIVVSTPNILSLNNFHAKAALGEQFPSIPIVVDNDTNFAALAEHRLGAGRGHPHMLYTAVSTGIGSGFIINNQLFRGAYGGAGESGHMIVTPNQGQVCGCGNQGCFMSYASGALIRKHILAAIEQGEPTYMLDMVERPEDITPIILEKAYGKGDGLAVRMVDQMGYYMGIYIYNMFIALNFDCYVLGGGLTKMGAKLFDRIRNTFDSFNHQAGQEIQIKAAELGEDCGIVGAALLLKEQL